MVFSSNHLPCTKTPSSKLSSQAINHGYGAFFVFEMTASNKVALPEKECNDLEPTLAMHPDLSDSLVVLSKTLHFATSCVNHRNYNFFDCIMTPPEVTFSLSTSLVLRVPPPLLFWDPPLPTYSIPDPHYLLSTCVQHHENNTIRPFFPRKLSVLRDDPFRKAHFNHASSVSIFSFLCNDNLSASNTKSIIHILSRTCLPGQCARVTGDST